MFAKFVFKLSYQAVFICYFQSIKEEIQKVPFCGVQTDIWSSLQSLHHHAAYVMSLPNFEAEGPLLRYMVLCVPEAPQDHSAEGLARHMQAVLEEFEFGLKKAGITTDSTNVNPAAMLKIVNWWFGCFAHTLHNSLLSTLDSEEEAKKTIECVRTIVKMIRSGKSVFSVWCH